MALFRPLQDMDIVLPSGLGLPLDVLVDQCIEIVENFRAYADKYSVDRPPLVPYFLYYTFDVSVSLVRFLQSAPRCEDAFLYMCRSLLFMSPLYHIAVTAMRGIMAISYQLGIPLPEASKPYWLNLPKLIMESKGIPVSFVVMGSDIGENNGQGSSSSGVELGKIVEKWSNMSI
jgi:hypothetical protein